MIGKILVIDPNVLSPEYRSSAYQIIKCTGGNGSRPIGMGSSVYGNRMVDKKSIRYERSDILGELKPECYPDWLCEKVKYYDNLEKYPTTFEYGGYHFIPMGIVKGNSHFDKVTQNISTDKSMRMWCDNYINLYGENTIPYSYDDFYKAGNYVEADIFYCIETGKEYMPSSNELFAYSGEYEEYKEPNIKLKSQDMER